MQQPEEQQPSDVQTIPAGPQQSDLLANPLLEAYRAVAESFCSLRMGEGFVFIQAKHLFGFDRQGDAKTL